MLNTTRKKQWRSGLVVVRLCKRLLVRSLLMPLSICWTCTLKFTHKFERIKYQTNICRIYTKQWLRGIIVVTSKQEVVGSNPSHFIIVNRSIGTVQVLPVKFELYGK